MPVKGNIVIIVILSNSQYYSPLSNIACVGNLVRNRMVASMACKSHLSFRAAQKFLFKYVYKTSVEIM